MIFRSLKICICLLVVFIATPLLSQTTIVLNSPDGGDKEYVASQEIILEPGYEYASNGNDGMWAYIDERLPGQPQYEPLYTDSELENRSINQSLDVGYTPGIEGVSNTGAATYSLPIKLPSGINGFMPSISVNYNSQSGDGLLGMGWNLAAASTITRIGKTIHHQGKTESIQMDNSDGFILDGKRFFPITGNNGQNNTEYAFETEDYSKVTSFGTSGNGPQWFKVETKNGMVMEFGKVSKSTLPEHGQSIMLWGLTKTYDQKGNYIEYEYKTYNNQLLLYEIRYTGNTVEGVDPFNTIKFYYNHRSDKNTMYSADVKLNSNYLLAKIEVASAGTLYKTYEFTYGLNDYSFLKKLTEIAPNNEQLNSTIFHYHKRDNSIAEASTTLNLHNNKDLNFADFDGDGIDDVLVITKKTTNVPYNLPGFGGQGTHTYYHIDGWELYINNNSTYTLSSSGSFSANEYFPTRNYATGAHRNAHLGDFNGDGMMDFAIAEIEEDNGLYHPKNINIYSSTGTSFSKQTKNIEAYYINLYKSLVKQDASQFLTPQQVMYFDQFNLWWSEVNITSSSVNINPYNFMVIGDFDGNGKSEILVNAEFNASYEMVQNPLETGSVSGNAMVVGYEENNSFFTSVKMINTNEHYALSIATDLIMPIRFDADTKTELCIVNGNNTQVLKFHSTNGGAKAEIVYNDAFPQITYEMKAGDFNGDLITDFLINDGTNWSIATGTGKEWMSQTFTAGSSFNSSSIDESLIIADVNGDGKTDIVHGKSSGGSNNLNVYYSTGSQFSQESYSTTQRFKKHQQNLLSVDHDGDGKLELAQTEDAVSAITQILDVSHPDVYQLRKVRNGFNKKTVFDYGNITNDAIYTKSAIGDDKTRSFQKSISVLHKLNTDNGIGGLNTVSYNYHNLISNRLGLGILGFEKVTSTNLSENTRKLVSNKLITMPPSTTLLPDEVNTFINNSNTHVSKTKTTYNTTSLGLNRNKIEISSNELIDYHNGWKTLVEFDYDGYSNVLKNTKTTSYYSSSAMIQKEEVNINYIDDAMGLSIPYLPSSKSLTIERNGEIPYTRTTDYEYFNNGLLKKTISDPNSTSNMVETTMSYDNFGNLLSSSTSASGLPSVTQQHTYSNNGRYLTQTTNTLGQTSSYEYNKSIDKLTKETGITGLITTYEYDVWGNLVKTTGPTGIIIESTLEWDVNTNTPTQQNAPSLTNSVFKQTTTSTGVGNTSTWIDVLGREVQTKAEHSSGTDLVTNTSHLANGRVHKKSDPHFVNNTASIITEYFYNDPLNRITKVENTRNTITYTYDVSVDALAKVTKTNSAGQSHTTYTDATGLVLKAEDNGGALEYTYYSHGKNKDVSLGSTVLTSMEYDAYGRQTKLVDKNAGETLYTYNAYGQLTKQEDANGVESEYTYNALGSILTETIDGTDVTTYDYYTSGGGLNALEKVTGPNNYAYEYEYDTYGRQTKITETIGSEIFSTSFEYNNLNQNTAIVYPSGHRINYAYNQGVVSQVTDGSGQVLFSNSSLNEYGNFTNYDLANGSITTTNTYNQYGLLEKLKTTANSTTLVEMDYKFQINTANLQSRKDVTRNLTETFGYDNLNRLTSMTIGGQTKTITYASNGNKTSETDLGSSSYISPVINQLTNRQENISPFQTLARTSPLQTVAYTKFDRTESITEGINSVTFHYGPNKNRKKAVFYQNSSTQKTRYYIGLFEKTVSSSGTTQEVHYISCGNGVTVVYLKEGANTSYHYLVKDYLGSIIASIDPTGSIEFEQNFDAWGRDRHATNWSYATTSSPITGRPNWLYRGYTGHEHLRDFTLINMNNRMYDTETGRMLAVDNYVANPYSTQAYNRYTYANNNPLLYTDPSGEIGVLAAVVIGATVGAYLGGSNANGTFNPAKWDYRSSTTWVAMGTGVIIGGATGGLGASGQLSYAFATTHAGVTLGGISLNNTGANYNLNLFAGQSSAGYNYNLASYKNNKFNSNPLEQATIFMPEGPGSWVSSGSAEVYNYNDGDLLIMGWTFKQIEYYRKTGKTATHSEAVEWLNNAILGADATALPISLMENMFIWANDAKIAKYAGYAGDILGLPALADDGYNLIKDPSIGNALKFSGSAVTTFVKGNPYVRASILIYDGIHLIMDARGFDPYLEFDKAIDRISW